MWGPPAAVRTLGSLRLAQHLRLVTLRVRAGVGVASAGVRARASERAAAGFSTCAGTMSKNGQERLSNFVDSLLTAQQRTRISKNKAAAKQRRKLGTKSSPGSASSSAGAKGKRKDDSDALHGHMDSGSSTTGGGASSAKRAAHTKPGHGGATGASVSCPKPSPLRVDAPTFQPAWLANAAAGAPIATTHSNHHRRGSSATKTAGGAGVMNCLSFDIDGTVANISRRIQHAEQQAGGTVFSCHEISG